MTSRPLSASTAWSRIAPAALTLLLAACGGSRARPNGDAVRDGVAASAPTVSTETCSLAGGAIRIGVPRPEGHAFASSPESCMLAEEPTEGSASELPLFLTLSAVEAEGGEAVLVGEDAVVRWVEQTGLLGSRVTRLGTEDIAIAGRPVRLQRLAGEPEGLEMRREIALTALRQGGHYVVVMAVYPPGDGAARARAQELIGRLVLR